MQRRSSRRYQSLILLSVCAIAAVAGCKRASEPLPGATTEPAATVRQLAQKLHDNDLAGYARAAVPPSQYSALETAWAQGHSRWPLTELPLDDKLPALLGALSEKGAEQSLQRAFRAQFEGQAASVRQAAHSLGLFGVQYITHQGDYTETEREHYVQLVTALSGWAQAAPLSDAKLARANITLLTTAARATGLDSDEALQEAGMTASLQRLGPFAGTLKKVLASYGLALDESVTQMRTGLVSENGDQAIVRVQYPLAGKEMDVQVALERREGHWYLARTLAEADQAIAAAQAAQQVIEQAQQQARLDAAAAETASPADGPEHADPAAKP